MTSPRFLWGATTSAHQVDHWLRWSEDFAMMKELGLNAYRLSLDWSRLEPTAGSFSQVVMDQYRAMLLDLRRLDIKIFLVLQDGPCPAWFTETGGWRSMDSAAVFSKYAQVVAQSLGDLVFGWVIWAEPTVLESTNWLQQVEMKLRLGRVRAQVAKVIRAAGPLARIEGYDWLSVNIGTTATDDLLSMLRRKKTRDKEIYLIDSQELSDEKEQADFIRDRLRIIEEAQAAGMSILGYFYDSLLDGGDETSAKKGLMAVDLVTQKRTWRPLSYVYKAIIQQATHSS